MKKIRWIFVLIFVLALLSACASGNEDLEEDLEAVESELEEAEAALETLEEHFQENQDNLEVALLDLEDYQNMYDELEMTLEASQEDYRVLEDELDLILASNELESLDALAGDFNVYDIWDFQDSYGPYRSIVAVGSDGESRSVYLISRSEDTVEVLDCSSDACAVIWSPRADYFIVDSGTSVVRGGTIFNTETMEEVGGFGYIDEPYWYDNENLIYEDDNRDIYIENFTELDDGIDICHMNARTGIETILLEPTETVYYKLVDYNDSSFTYNMYEIVGEDVIPTLGLEMLLPN